MPIAIKLRREFEPSLAALGDSRLMLISPVLRVGGELGTFGADRIENVKIADKQAECEVVVDARNWREMSEDEISAVIRPRVVEALRCLLTEAGFDAMPECLCGWREQTDPGSAPRS